MGENSAGLHEGQYPKCPWCGAPLRPVESVECMGHGHNEMTCRWTCNCDGHEFWEQAAQAKWLKQR